MAAHPGASTKSSDLLHLNVTFYKRTGEDLLVKKTLFYMFGEPRTIPRNQGDTLQMFRYQVPAWAIQRRRRARDQDGFDDEGPCAVHGEAFSLHGPRFVVLPYGAHSD